MRSIALATFLLFIVLPAAAQTGPTPPPPPPPQPQPQQEQQPPPESSWLKGRWFFGGGFGASFGTVDTISVAPMVGLRVAPRVSVGVQPFYSWVDDGRYSPNLTFNDYGATLFARVRVFRSLFGEADYLYSNYEYPSGPGQTSRADYNAFLAGGGYAIPLGGNASLYVSALYDFSYDDNDPFLPYDSPWRVQVGATVGF